MTPAHPQQKAAEALARRIEAHWAAQGHDVAVGPVVHVPPAANPTPKEQTERVV